MVNEKEGGGVREERGRDREREIENEKVREREERIEREREQHMLKHQNCFRCIHTISDICK